MISPSSNIAAVAVVDIIIEGTHDSLRGRVRADWIGKSERSPATTDRRQEIELAQNDMNLVVAMRLDGKNAHFPPFLPTWLDLCSYLVKIHKQNNALR